jgi:hypothetical protein
MTQRPSASSNDDELIPVMLRTERAAPRPPVVKTPWLFAGAMASALTVAATAGVGLGTIAALEAWIGESHWTAAVQGHGRIQLLSFAAVFVAALSFEFIVRLNGRGMLPVGPRVATLAFLGSGAVLMAAAQLFEGSATGLLEFGAIITLVGALSFATIILAVRPAKGLRDDLHPLFFRAAAVWLIAAAAVMTAGAFGASAGIVDLADSRAGTELLLRGFVLNTIVAVSLRALPGHLGTRPVSPVRQALVFGGLNGSLLVWLLASDAAVFAEASVVMRMADLLLAISLVAFAWWAGIMQRLRMPGPGVPRYQAFVPLAWLGALAYALALAVFAIDGGLYERTLYQEGAVRHLVMLGFMAPLMLAFAHIVLARFGTGTIFRENLLSTAFVLLMIAWPLRAAPALLVDVPSTPGRMVIATSGGIAAIAFAMAAYVCLVNARRLARAHQGHTTRRPALPAHG